MQLLEKKAKCPLCGAKNPVDAPRCGTCTRPLQNDPLPSQALYDEALWSTKIASKGARSSTNPYAVLALLVVAAVIVNYFVLGFGPSWAHEAKPQAKGFEWKVYTGQPDYRADLPGEPITGSAGAFGTTLTTATVWVDGHWDLVRDRDTRSVGALDLARRNVHAALILASGPAPADPATALSTLVQTLQPDTQLEPGGVDTVQDPPYGQQITLATSFTGFPEANGSGTVRATAIVLDGKVYIAASFVTGGDDPSLHSRLTSHFTPAGAPE